MTSSIKPEMHDVSEVDRAMAIDNIHKKLAKIGRVVPKIWSRTDKQHTHTDRDRQTRSSQYSAALCCSWWTMRGGAERRRPGCCYWSELTTCDKDARISWPSRTTGPLISVLPLHQRSYILTGNEHTHAHTQPFSVPY